MSRGMGVPARVAWRVPERLPPGCANSVFVSQQAYAGNKRLQPGTGVVGIAVRVKVY